MSDYRISSGARNRIEELCGRMACGSEEVRRELAGHLQDKLAAYLTGREALSEEDALILVEKHFGDPAVVGRLLEGVHGPWAGESLGRRVAAAFVLSSVVIAGTNVIAWGLAMGAARGDGLPGWASLVPDVLGVVAVWGVLWRWRRGAERGEGWFASWGAGRMVAVMVVTFIVAEASAVLVAPGGAEVGVRWQPMGGWGIGIALGLYLLRGCAWAWWCDRAGRRWSWPAVVGAAAWGASMYVRVLLGPVWEWSAGSGMHAVWRPWAWEHWGGMVAGAGLLSTLYAAGAVLMYGVWELGRGARAGRRARVV